MRTSMIWLHALLTVSLCYAASINRPTRRQAGENAHPALKLWREMHSTNSWFAVTDMAVAPLAKHNEKTTLQFSDDNISRRDVPQMQVHKVEKRLGLAAAGMIASGFGFGSALAGWAINSACTAYGWNASWYGKALCVGIPVLIGVLGVLVPGGIAYNTYHSGQVLGNIQGAASIALDVVRVATRRAPIDTPQAAAAHFADFAHAVSKHMMNSSMVSHDLTLPYHEDEVLHGTNIVATHGMHLMSALVPLLLTNVKYNVTRMAWRSNIRGNNTMHSFVPVGGASLVKRGPCEQGNDPVYGPGEGNPTSQFCADGDEFGGVYYGQQFYGSESQWDSVAYAFGSGNDQNAENFANTWANDMEYWNHDASCVCFQDQNQNNQWVGTGSIEVASWGEDYEGYSQCWAANCGAG